MSKPESVEDTHNERSKVCWCHPDLVCALCKDHVIGPCIHGAPGTRIEVVVHRQAS